LSYCLKYLCVIVYYSVNIPHYEVLFITGFQISLFITAIDSRKLMRDHNIFVNKIEVRIVGVFFSW